MLFGLALCPNSASLPSGCLVTEDPQAPCSWQRKFIFSCHNNKVQNGRPGIVSYGKTHRKGQLKEAVLFSDISCQGQASSKGRKKNKKKEKKQIPVECGFLISRDKMALSSHPLSLPFAE